MKSLAVRLTLLALVAVAAGVASYFVWTVETRARMDRDAYRAFDATVVGAERDVLELRGAQQAYVAGGQGHQYWTSKVTAAATALRETLNTLRTLASAPPAQSAVDNASSALQDFEQMDRRARDYTRNGQKLLASDIIFGEGLELTGAAVTSLEEARLAERQARDTAAAALHDRALAATGGAASAGLLVILLLVPRGSAPPPIAEGTVRAPVRTRAISSTAAPDPDVSLDEGWSKPKITARAAPAPPAAPVPAPAPAQAPRAAPALDLAAVASLCTDLARVSDTLALPAILERAAAVLDAPGIVLWIADPDGRELSPIVTHGYAPQVVSRLGTILRDTENATASAFRTSLLQTVKADAVSNGAIAAPLVTPGGCVGVMAAEVRREGEKDNAKLAAATIVAAQLATLVGPPSVRTQAKAEAAGA